MELICECFDYYIDLASFVNSNGITKENIQAILIDNDDIVLYYWDEK